MNLSVMRLLNDLPFLLKRGYELAWKMIRRFLVADLGSEALAPISRKDLFRLAADKLLITEPLAWFLYHNTRNSTSHIYDEVIEDELIADEVYDVAKLFLTDAKNLLAELQQRND